MSRWTRLELLILAAILYLCTATIAHAQTWKNGAITVPCAVHQPFETFVNPGDNQVYYLGADTVATNLWKPGTYVDAAYGAHVRAYVGDTGMLYPMMAELGPANGFPAPPPEANLCKQYEQPYGLAPKLQNTNACPFTGNYPAKMAANVLWLGAWGPSNASTLSYEANCLGIVHATPTKAPVPPVKTATRPAGGGTCCDPPNCPAGAPIPPCKTPTKVKSPVPPVTFAATATKAPLPPTPEETIAAPSAPAEGADSTGTPGPTSSTSSTPTATSPGGSGFPLWIIAGAAVVLAAIIYLTGRPKPQA